MAQSIDQDDILDSDHGSDHGSDHDVDSKKDDIDRTLRKVDASDTYEKASALVDRCLDAHGKIFGVWDEDLLIWKQISGGVIWLSNLMHRHLDPKGTLPRLIRTKTLGKYYCSACRIIIKLHGYHKISKFNPLYANTPKRMCYNKPAQYLKYMVYHKKFSFIERALITYLRGSPANTDKQYPYNDNLRYYPKIQSMLHPEIISLTSTYMKRNVVTYIPGSGKFVVGSERQKNKHPVNFFIDEEIDEEDVLHYNKEAYDIYLIDLLGGKDNYDIFMYNLTQAFAYKCNKPYSLFIKGSTTQTGKVKHILSRLFKRFIHTYGDSYKITGFIVKIKMTDLDYEDEITLQSIYQRAKSKVYLTNATLSYLTIFIGKMHH